MESQVDFFLSVTVEFSVLASDLHGMCLFTLLNADFFCMACRMRELGNFCFLEQWRFFPWCMGLRFRPLEEK